MKSTNWILILFIVFLIANPWVIPKILYFILGAFIIYLLIVGIVKFYFFCIESFKYDKLDSGEIVKSSKKVIFAKVLMGIAFCALIFNYFNKENTTSIYLVLICTFVSYILFTIDDRHRK